MVSEIFDASRWVPVEGFAFRDITYHRSGAVRIAFNRPEVRNAFRPQTVDELYTALDHARQTSDVGVRAAHRQRPLAQRRRLGLLLRRRPAHPRSSTATSTRATAATSTSRASGGCTSSRCSG
jgi:hypothetical protein